jgi:Plavaka transposase
MKRKSFIKHLCNKFNTPPPDIYPVHLESHLNNDDHSNARQIRDTVEVVCFDFSEQLKDILSDNTLFGDLSNLVVNNGDDKWHPFRNTTGNIHEVLDAKWYQEFVIPSVTNPNKQFAIPIGMYIDASETVTYQRYSFQPLMIFPLILNLKARNKNTSSRVIALIPDLEAKSSADKGMSIQNYHKCIDVALQSLVKAQEDGVHCYVRLGNEIKFWECKVPLAFILGDAKSQDTLCGRYGGQNTSRMCRACNVSFDDCDNTDWNCQCITGDQFQRESEVYLTTDDPCEKRNLYQSLHNMSQHAVINAFTQVDFANNPRGIFGATPHDPMHMFLEGILKYCTGLICSTFTTKGRSDIDIFVDTVFGNHRSSEKRNMLRTNFTKGMTNLKMVTADEQAGIALTLLIIAQLDVGRDILSKSISTENDSLVDKALSREDDSDDDDQVNQNDLRRRNGQLFAPGLFNPAHILT